MEFPTIDKLAKDTAEKALDEFLYDGRSIREWMQIIASEDCIKRQEVLDKIKEVCFSKEQEWVDFRVLQGSNGQRDLIIKFIEDLPSVQPKPKTGQWINIEDRTDWYDTSYKCSCCGREIITPYDFKNNLYSDYPYCHCGARMVGPQESEGEK